MVNTNNVLMGENFKNYNKSIPVKAHKLRACSYCFAIDKKKNVIKCNRCKEYTCKHCLTFVNDKPFCNECIVDIVRNEKILMITTKKIF